MGRIFLVDKNRKKLSNKSLEVIYMKHTERVKIAKIIANKIKEKYNSLEKINLV